jgi:hypothetical protein
VVYYHYTVNYDCVKQFKERRMIMEKINSQQQDEVLLVSAKFKRATGCEFCLMAYSETKIYNVSDKDEQVLSSFKNSHAFIFTFSRGEELRTGALLVSKERVRIEKNSSGKYKYSYISSDGEIELSGKKVDLNMYLICDSTNTSISYFCPKYDIMPETPVIETPVIETPVIETPVIETPVIETPVIETPVIETQSYFITLSLKELEEIVDKKVNEKLEALKISTHNAQTNEQKKKIWNLMPGNVLEMIGKSGKKTQGEYLADSIKLLLDKNITKATATEIITGAVAIGMPGSRLTDSQLFTWYKKSLISAGFISE